MVQVDLEDLDGLQISLLLGVHAHIGLDGGRQEAIEGILTGRMQEGPVAR